MAGWRSSLYLKVAHAGDLGKRKVSGSNEPGLGSFSPGARQSRIQFDILITYPVLQGHAPARQKGRSRSPNDPQPVPATTRSHHRPPVTQANTSKGPEPDRSKCPSGLTRKITPKNKP